VKFAPARNPSGATTKGGVSRQMVDRFDAGSLVHLPAPLLRGVQAQRVQHIEIGRGGSTRLTHHAHVATPYCPALDMKLFPRLTVG
jgi:hypothetical protein